MNKRKQVKKNNGIERRTKELCFIEVGTVNLQSLLYSLQIP